jgi:hypothetical protein
VVDSLYDHALRYRPDELSLQGLVVLSVAPDGPESGARMESFLSAKEYNHPGA